jgi:hypothetical protein
MIIWLEYRWLEYRSANSAFMTPVNIMSIICKREQYGKPCSFFHHICKGMIHLSFRDEKNANECFEIAKRLLMLENSINVELYMLYLNKD